MIWKYKIDNLIRELELKNNPVIVTVNKFNEESAKEFRKNIAMAHNTGQKVIPVIIDSYGGQVYSLLSMIDTIQNSELPIATIVNGKAMSCGALLFSFGTEGMRYMGKESTLMIHDVSSMSWGKDSEIQASAQEVKRLNDKVYTMLAKNCGHDDDYFKKIVHEKSHADWFLDSKEALKHNIANFLKVPKMNIEIKVNIDIE